MSYQEFLNACLIGVKKIAGKEAEVLIHKVTKNNGIVLDGIIIMEPGRKYSPTVYMNRFYEEYKKGVDIDDIAQEVYMLYVSNRNNIVLPENFFVDYQSVSNRIAYKIVNYKKNEALLQQIPHRKWMDLAIVYYVVYDDIDKDRAIILIYNNHLKYWGIGEQELYDNAKKNTPNLYPVSLKLMSDIVIDMYKSSRTSSEDIDELIMSMKEQEKNFPMYVLTNETKNCGAVCMLYDNVIEEISEKLKSDIYIIPSSIHEVILIPASEEIDMQSMKELVNYVNREEVPIDQVLSDTVYKYVRHDGFQ